MIKDERIDKRSRYVVQEINRLVEVCSNLENGNLTELGKNMFATHDGLSKMYQVSCKELDWLVDKVRNNPNVLGARMMGGGFGGCVIALVQTTKVEEVYNRINNEYQNKFGRNMGKYLMQIGDGTRLLD